VSRWFRRALVAALAFASSLAWAQAPYPAKPIRLVVPFAPGGPVDTLGRAMQPKLAEALGQQIVIDNRAGAGSIIGTEVVVRSPPDGYALLLTSSSIAINPSIYPKVPFDATRDLAPISQISTSSLIAVVHPSVPVRSIKERSRLRKHAKAS
jgi:tripartite-type tricarboxylate transporter receptor subunit TctC